MKKIILLFQIAFLPLMAQSTQIKKSVLGSASVNAQSSSYKLHGTLGQSAVGYAALSANVSSNYNTGIGRQALSNTTGAANTSVGYRAGDIITSGSSNVIIGVNADPSAVAAVNQIVIG